MAFIKFTEHGRSYAAKASISKSGMLSFNDGARRRFKLDGFKFCILYYDPDTQRVGIELTNDENAEGARKIRLRDTGADVAARSFLEFFAVARQQTMLYTAEFDSETGFVLIDLQNGRVRGSRKQMRDKRTNPLLTSE